MVKIGALKRRITIRRATSTLNALNKPVETWTMFAVLWAAVRGASAEKFLRARAVDAEITMRFTVRKTPVTDTITPRDMVRFDGQDYNIVGVHDVEGGRMFREIDAVRRA